LLETYLARLEALSDKIEDLASNIETTQGMLELILDNERNRIARLELVLSMSGLGVGTCAAVSGFFGMNLLSGLENVPGLFALVCFSSVIVSSAIIATCWRRFRSVSRDQRSRLYDVQALKHVLGDLDKIAILLRNRPPLPRDRVSMQAELREVLADSNLQPMSNRQLGLLYSILRQEPSVPETFGSQGPRDNRYIQGLSFVAP